jgi:hypothetical protein
VDAAFDQTRVTTMAAAYAPPSLLTVIEHAVRDARDRGLDESWQYRKAIAAVRRVEPDLNLLSASRLVNALLESQDHCAGAVHFASGRTHGAKLPG